MTIMFVDHHRNHPQEEKKNETRVCYAGLGCFFSRKKRQKQILQIPECLKRCAHFLDKKK